MILRIDEEIFYIQEKACACLPIDEAKELRI